MRLELLGKLPKSMRLTSNACFQGTCSIHACTAWKFYVSIMWASCGGCQEVLNDQWLEKLLTSYCSGREAPGVLPSCQASACPAFAKAHAVMEMSMKRPESPRRDEGNSGPARTYRGTHQPQG